MVKKIYDTVVKGMHGKGPRKSWANSTWKLFVVWEFRMRMSDAQTFIICIDNVWKDGGINIYIMWDIQDHHPQR